MEKIQNRKLKLSRRDKIRRNPIPWIIILLIAVVICLLCILPKYEAWNSKKIAIKSMNTKVPTLENKVAVAKEKWNETERKFNKEKGPIVITESQVFPEEIDVYSIVRVLETFSIAMKNLESVLLKDTYFELEAVNFGKSKKGKRNTETPLTLKFSANDENIRKFIKYLQKNELPKDFEQMENSDVKFLQNNLLPIMHINSINITEQQVKKTEENTTKIPHFTAQLQITIFSR